MTVDLSSMASGSEWQMARQWMIDAGVIPPYHRATKPTADLVDLSNCLRDGSFLCDLCNRIEPNAIRQIHSRPQRQFLCMQNINAFLSCCNREFGMEESALFQATDLYEVSDFGAVVRTLSTLSKTRHALAAGLQSFPPERYQGADDEIYANLEDEWVQRSAADKQEQDSIYAAVDFDEYDEEDIYGSVVPSKQATPERTASVESKRTHVLTELLDTERSYVDALQMIVDHFLHPMMNSINMEDKSKIFLNIELLLKDHKKFLEKLETSNRKGATDISTCFLAQVEDLLKYGFFCSRLPDAQDKINQMMKDTILGKKLEMCKVRSRQRFGLKELMCVPMQRTLKYPLLLRELIKHTSEHHQDRKGLEEALEAVNSAAMTINEAKKQYEMHQTILQIQNSLIDFPGGRLIDQGDMLQDGELKVKFGEASKVKLRYVFLFDRALLVCQSRSEQFVFKQMLRWHDYTVHDVTSAAKGKWAHSWNLVGPSPAVACSLFAKTIESKRRWLHLVESACEKCKQEGDQNFRRSSERYIKTPGERGALPLPPTPNRPPMPPPGPSSADRRPVSREASGSKSPTATSANRSGGRLRGFPFFAVQNYRGQPHPGIGSSVILFDKGDEILVTNQSDRDWWEGTHKKTNTNGLFPAGLVKSQEELKLDKQRHRSRMSYEESFPQVRKESREWSPPLSPVEATASSPSSPESPEAIRQKYSSAPWFVGRMARNEADSALASTPDGTFLIRESDNRPGDFALSIKFGQSKHIKIVTKCNMFQLSDLKQCPTIEALVDHYKRNTLALSFPGLDTTLVHPYKSVCNTTAKWCRALYSFQGRDREELGLDENCDVRIINKDTGRSGWWFGECKGKVGLFPSNYVREY